MEFLWTADLKINTVHVLDVVRAVWHTANWYVSSDNTSPGKPVIFNVVDQNDTSKCKERAIDANLLPNVSQSVLAVLTFQIV